MLDEVDPYMEAAVLWLAQTILVSLLTGKLEAWIRQVGLAGEIDKLKSEVERVEMVVATVKGRAIGNKPLARSLARLKELLYDADDAVDELDYYRLQQHVQEVNSYEPEEGTQAAEQEDEGSRGPPDIPGSSGCKKRRSAAWEHFEDPKVETGRIRAKCKYCGELIVCESKNGTSAMRNHTKKCKNKPGPNDQPPNHSSTADGMLVATGSSRGDATADATPIATGNTAGDATHVATGSSHSGKRKRTDEKSGQTTTANTQTPRWNKAEWSNRIQEITRQLQEIRGDVRGVLKILGSDSATSSTSDPRLRTSSLVQSKMYGRAEEKEYIIKLMAEDRAEDVTVLPIVGIAGAGKTALAQHVYNDPTVEKQFERIWVWVSVNFDEVMLTREILDFVSRERHNGSPENNEGHEGISRFSSSNQGISSFSMLQEILKRHMKSQSKRFLLIFDYVWDNLDDNRWNKLLVPFRSSHWKGNVIVVTTRSLSVAQRIGTLEPVKLGALKDDDFLSLFKSHAFGDENYEGHRSLSIIGQKIAEKLKGNPLAAKSTGVLLREKLETDHWSSILKNEDWKSLQLDGGIMPALKLSYDQLPYHLQQCFSYCSIFPYNHEFLDEELVRIWISQGFVKYRNSSQRLEEIGRCYLTDLVNLGFFKQVDKKESFVCSEKWYGMCGLMHDFARMVSRTECATIDGLQYNEILPTVRHLSIVTDSARINDQDGNITCNKDFEENLRNTVALVRKLRTMVLIGKYDPLFSQLFQDIFQKAQNLRLLQMHVTSADFEALVCSSVNPVHLRYFKRESCEEEEEVLPQVLNKFYHLQVLDVGLNNETTAPNGLHNLVSLRHLVAEEKVHSSIGRIGQMTSLQKLKDFSVQESRGFKITQLQSMNELVHLGVSQLENIKSREEAYGAKLRDKRHLKKLFLSWRWNNILSREQSDNHEVLEGLEPNMDLKHLHISGYNGTSPTWLGNNITSLQTLHLEDCGKWEILPPLERLPFLTKLKLRNMQKVIEVLVPSLEELVLIKMPMLKRCSCTSVSDLNSTLRVLLIESCDELKQFDLFENSHKFEIKQKAWLPGLQKFTIRDCPVLEGLNPFPPSTTSHEWCIRGVSTLPMMQGSSSQTLTIGLSNNDYDKYSYNLRTLDNKILAFHNLTSLKLMRIRGCRNLKSMWLKGFSELVSLINLEIVNCKELFSWHGMPRGHTHEDMDATNWRVFPSLKSVTIELCGITAEWLSLILRHAPVLEEPNLEDCPRITYLLIGEEQDSQPNLTLSHAAAVGHRDVALTHSAPVNESNFFSPLRNITIVECRGLLGVGNKGWSRFTSLEKLQIRRCPHFLRSMVHEDGRWLLPQSLRELEIRGHPWLLPQSIRGDSPETLQPCFIGNQTCLTKLEVDGMQGLKSLQLDSCTALEELNIDHCMSLDTLEGLQSLGSLRCLEIYSCPGLRPLERFFTQGLDLCTRLSRLETLSIPEGGNVTQQGEIAVTSEGDRVNRSPVPAIEEAK